MNAFVTQSKNQNVFKHINKRTQTTINKHSFTTYYEKSSYYIKRIKEENDVIFQLECKRRFRKRIAHSTFLKHEKKECQKD